MTMAPRAKFTGTGMFVPDRVVTNDDLAKLMDTSDEWIRQRSGVVERRYIEEGQTPADLAHEASERALEAAGLEPADIDCIVLATLSPHADFPGTSFFLHELLGAPEIPCFDLRAQCSGFVYSLAVAKSMIEAGQFRRVLVVGCEVHSTGIDLTDEGRDVAVLFGDGAGAVVLEANEDASDAAGLIEVRLHAEGRYAKKLWLEAPGSGFTPVRITHEMLDAAPPLPAHGGALRLQARGHSGCPRCCSRRSTRRASSSRTWTSSSSTRPTCGSTSTSPSSSRSRRRSASTTSSATATAPRPRSRSCSTRRCATGFSGPVSSWP